MSGNTGSAVRDHVEAIWNDVLGVPDGQGGTFFDLGGQSMSAIRIVARISDELGITVDVAELFDDPDLETFAGSVVARASQLRAS